MQQPVRPMVRLASLNLHACRTWPEGDAVSLSDDDLRSETIEREARQGLLSIADQTALVVSLRECRTEVEELKNQRDALAAFIAQMPEEND